MMAVVDLMVERVWPVAKKIILSWDDRASEIFILDLPLDNLPRILNEVMLCTEIPVVLRFDGINLDQPRPLEPRVRDQLVQASKLSTVHSLRGGVSERGNCYFYFWIDAEQRSIETEIVFWNDLCFPPGRAASNHKAMLGRLLRIAHRIRGDNHQSTCILSPEYNSEPRELLNGEHRQVAIW